MANEYSIVTTVDASGATKGSREFKRSLSDIAQSAVAMVKHTDRIRSGFRQMGTQGRRELGSLNTQYRATASTIQKTSSQIVQAADKAGKSIDRSIRSAVSSTAYLSQQYALLPRSVGAYAASVEAGNKRAAGSFGLVGKAAMSLRTTLMGFAAGFTLTAAIGQIADFDKSMGQMRALMSPQQIQTDFAQVSAKARELGATTIYSAGQAAGAMVELVKAGQSASQAMASAGGVLNMAAAESMDLAQAAAISANVLAAFGMKAEESGRVADVLATAANASQTSIVGLGEGMKYVGAIAAAAHIPLEDMATVMGALSNAGVDDSMAGTWSRALIEGLLNPSKTTKAALDKMGISVEDVKKKLAQPGGFVEVIKMLKPIGEDAGLAMKALGDRGGPALVALTNQLKNIGSDGVDGLTRLQKAMEDSTGQAEYMARQMNNTLWGSLQELLSAAEELALQLGDAGLKDVLWGVADAIGAFARGLGGFSEDAKYASDTMNKMNEVGQFLRNNLDTIKTALILLAAVFVSRWIAALVKGIATTIAATAENVRYQIALARMAGASTAAGVATTITTTAVRGLNLAMAAMGGPIGLIITGLTIAATMLLTFKSNAEKAAESVDDLGSKLDVLSSKWEKAGQKQRAYMMVQARQVADEAKTNADILKKQIAQSDAAKKELASRPMYSGSGGNAQTALYGGETARLQGMVLSADKVSELNSKIEELEGTARKAEGTLRLMQDGTLGAADAVKNHATTAAAAAATTSQLAGSLDTSGKASKELAKQQREAAKAQRELTSDTDALMKTLNPLAQAEKEHNEQVALLGKLSKMTDAQLKELGYTHADVTRASDALAAAWAKQQGELDPLKKKYTDLVSDMDNVASQARPAAAALEEYNAKLAVANQLMGESDAQIASYGTTREKITQYIKDLGVAYDKATGKIQENEDKSQTWYKSWERAIERVDDAMLNLWKSGMNGFDDFKDSLKNAFKDMLAELAHAKITKPITDWFSGMLKGISSGNSSSGGGGLMDMFKGMFGQSGGSGSGLSGIFGGVKNWFTGLFSGGGGTKATQSLNMFYDAAKGLSTAVSGAGAAGGAGGGFGAFGPGAAGWIGTGSGTGAAGAGAGASAGAAAVPIIGWVIAGMMKNMELFNQGWRAKGGDVKGLGHVFGGATNIIDSALQKLGLSEKLASLVAGSSITTRLFGRKQPEVKETGLNGELSMAGFTGTQYANIVAKGGVFRSDKKWTQTSAVNSDVQKYINAATLGVRQMITSIGEASDEATKNTLSTLKINLGKLVLDKDPAKAQEQLKEYADRFNDALSKAAARAMGFGRVVDDPALDISGTELLELLKAFQETRNLDAYTKSVEEYEKSQRSGIENYRKQKTEFDALLVSYDGSYDSLKKLATATEDLKKAQAELVLAYLQVRDTVKTMLSDTRQNIRESLMNPEQLYATRQQQIQDLMAQMSTETDPTKLGNIAAQINKYVGDAYGMLDEDQKKSLAGGFISFLDEVESLLNEQVDEGLNAMEGESDSTTTSINAKLDSVADKQMAAANTFAAAVDAFTRAVGGGAITAKVAKAAGLEVNA